MLTRRIGEPPLLVGSLLLLAIALEAATLWVGIDDLDEGYFAQQATRVLHGQIPYRDFDSLYTPGLLYVHAGLFFVLGGPSLVGLRIVSLVGRALIAGLMYVLGRSLARPGWAIVPPLFLLLGLDPAPARWEPHPGWLSTAFALLSAGLFPRATLAAGAAAGLAFAFKQNTGVFALAAAVLFTWLSRAQDQAWLQRVIRLGAGFGLVTLAWLVPLLVALDGQVARLSAFIGGVNQAALFSPPDWVVLLPILAGLLGVWFGWRCCRDPHLAWYLVAGAFLFLTEYPRMDGMHLLWSAPLLLVVGAIVVGRLSAQVRILTVTTLLLASLPAVTWRTEWLREPLAPLIGPPPADDLLVPPRTRDDLLGVVNSVRARTAQHEPIFVYPSSPLLYILADRPNPTRYDHLYPGAAPPNEVQSTMTQLADVRIVVTGDFWTAFLGTGGDNIPLERYLAEHYHEVACFGAYHVLERETALQKATTVESDAPIYTRTYVPGDAVRCG